MHSPDQNRKLDTSPPTPSQEVETSASAQWPPSPRHPTLAFAGDLSTTRHLLSQSGCKSAAKLVTPSAPPTNPPTPVSPRAIARDVSPSPSDTSPPPSRSSTQGESRRSLSPQPRIAQTRSPRGLSPRTSTAGTPTYSSSNNLSHQVPLPLTNTSSNTSSLGSSSTEVSTPSSSSERRASMRLEPQTHAGYLKERFNGQWFCFWYELSLGVLYRYKTYEERATPLSKIQLEHVSFVERGIVNNSYEFELTLNTNYRVYQAPTELDYLKWIVALQANANYTSLKSRLMKSAGEFDPQILQEVQIALQVELPVREPLDLRHSLEQPLVEPLSRSLSPDISSSTKPSHSPSLLSSPVIQQRSISPGKPSTQSPSATPPPAASSSTTTEKSGWITKLGGTAILPRWQKRWSVLRDGVLNMYKTQEQCTAGTGVTTTFDLHFCTARVLDSTQKRQYCFSIITPRKNYILSVENGPDMLDWITVLQRAQAAAINSLLAYSAIDKKSMNLSRAALHDLVQLPGNDVCADCDTPKPLWASVSLGVFLCISCSGIHRKLGVHISYVRSVTLDNWTSEQIATLQNTGNVKANAIFEASVKDGFSKPTASSAMEEREKYIRAKYEQKRFMAH